MDHSRVVSSGMSTTARHPSRSPRKLGGTPPPAYARLHEAVLAEHRRLWRGHVERVNGELQERAAPLFTRVAMEVHAPPVRRLLFERVLPTGALAEEAMA